LPVVPSSRGDGAFPDPALPLAVGPPELIPAEGAPLALPPEVLPDERPDVRPEVIPELPPGPILEPLPEPPLGGGAPEQSGRAARTQLSILAHALLAQLSASCSTLSPYSLTWLRHLAESIEPVPHLLYAFAKSLQKVVPMLDGATEATA